MVYYLKENKSEVVDGINYVQQQKIISTTYCTIAGHKIQLPVKGINIKVTRFDNGKKQIEKIIIN